MTNAIRHRGPDGEGVFKREGVSLGHRRLAIIDLEAGQQPMCNADRSVWITYNGEIYNYLELRHELLERGRAFVTRSDTEVVLRAYEEWGPQCLNKFRGMFAFGVADFKEKKLLLARDHFGIKPLLYRIGNGYLAFASELSALCQVEDDLPSGNLESIELYLRYQYIPTPHTIYNDVFKLPPASYMEVGFDGRINNPKKYWNLSFDPVDGIADEEWKIRAEDAVRESVKSHLISDVPFGVLLSGGIDSSLVALQMSNILKRPIKAFAIGFEEQEYSEITYAKEAAKRCGIQLYTDIIRDDTLEILPDLISHYGEPFGDSSAIPTWYVSRLAREFVPMVLSGDGGDEAFGGYNTYIGWMEINRKHQLNMLSPLTFLRSVQQSIGHFTRNAPKKMLADWQSIILYADKERRQAIWRVEYQHLIDMRCMAFEAAAYDARQLDRLAYAQYLDYQTYLPCDILTKVDIASMYHGLEVRTPLVDIQVVELASKLPLTQRYRRNASGDIVSKYLLKQILMKAFQPEFVNRRKQGFAIPRASWLLPGRQGRKMFEQVMLDPLARSYRLFNPDQIRAQLEAHNETNDNSAVLWLLLVLGLWLEQHPTIHFS